MPISIQNKFADIRSMNIMSISEPEKKNQKEKEILKMSSLTIKKKNNKKKIIVVKKKKDASPISYYNKFVLKISKDDMSKNEPEKKMMTEQQRQTEISRRVKNYWLREKKNKLVCLIGIGQTLKGAWTEASKDDVGEINHIYKSIQQFRPNLFPEIAEMKNKLIAVPDNRNRRRNFLPSSIIHQRVVDWTTKNEKKIKKKIMKSVRLSMEVNTDNNINAHIHSNNLHIKNPLRRVFKKTSIVKNKDISDHHRHKITYMDVLDWKSSVFSQIKYYRHFCDNFSYERSRDEIAHHEYAQLYEGVVNKHTKISSTMFPTLKLGEWFNPHLYANSYHACRQSIPAHKITDEASWRGEIEKITDGTTIDGQLHFDYLSHIEIAREWEKTSKWSSLKWKIISNFNLVPQMCSSLNISITVFKQLYLLMLKDLKKRLFVVEPYKNKEKSLWAIFHNKWNSQSHYEKIIYHHGQGLYLSSSSNDNLNHFQPPSHHAYQTLKLNLTFKNEVEGKEYEIDFTRLIVMSLMIGSKGGEDIFTENSVNRGQGKSLVMYARKWVGVNDKERISSYILNSKLYPNLCVLKSDLAYYQ
tara:strand:- start:468 stop:2216 length:1749 start_codon:yes stop_codon:yes gene_type:complete